MPPLKVLLSFLAASCLCAPALAVEDIATGLKVDLPDDFIVEISAVADPSYDVLIGVNAASGNPPIIATSPYLCGVAYIAAPQNAGFTQAQINAMIDTPGWGEQARQSMASVMTFERTNGFELAGAAGVEFIATPKVGPDHENVRLVLSMLETPKGRTVVTCAATTTTLKKALRIFRTVRDGVTPPS